MGSLGRKWVQGPYEPRRLHRSQSDGAFDFLYLVDNLDSQGRIVTKNQEIFLT